MNYYDNAHETARAIKESSEYLNYRQARENLEANQNAWQMMKDIRAKQTDLQQQILTGQEPSQEKIAELNTLMEEVTGRSDAVNFLKTEMALIRVVEEVQLVIIQALGVEL